jgi:hypothetical protein
MRKAPVHHYKISISDDHPCLISERRRQALNEINQTLRTRCDMSTVLNLVRGPIALSRYVVPFVEESIERLYDECLVLFLFSSAH